MFHRHGSELRPRNGRILVVGIVARISGCQNQKEVSLDDQVDHAQEVVREHYAGEVDCRIIATKGKGERLDRPELAEIEEQLRAHELDLLVVEDLGRLVRGAEAVRLLGIAVDHQIRVLSPNDCIDTMDPTWEEDALSACRDHVGHNAHTSKRLKHKLMNRFVKSGGAVALPPAGYIIPMGAKTYGEWQLDGSATSIIRKGHDVLRETLNYSAVADLFNRTGFAVGPYCRRTTWNGPMVRRFYKNPILKGCPGRGFRHSVKHHETGRRVSTKNPNGPQFRDERHLAHLDPVEFDELNSVLEQRNRHLGRPHVNGADPRRHMPRKRTRFPGQHARCHYCGRQFVWGGNGITRHLMCAGARERSCWNSVGFDGELAARRVVNMLTTELYRLDGIDDQFRALVIAARQAHGDQLENVDALRAEQLALSRQKENLVSAIAEYGPQPMFREKLDGIEASERSLAQRLRRIEVAKNQAADLPESPAALRCQLEGKMAQLSLESPEFGNLLRLLVPEFHVHLVRLCDGGHLLPRAIVKLALAGSVADAQRIPGLNDLLTRTLSVDLFDPPQREQIRVEAVRLNDQGLNQRGIAEHISGRPTQTAVHRALVLHQRMLAAGLANPYVTILQPPDDYAKLRRHKNTKYDFRPLDGYLPPVI